MKADFKNEKFIDQESQIFNIYIQLKHGKTSFLSDKKVSPRFELTPLARTELESDALDRSAKRPVDNFNSFSYLTFKLPIFLRVCTYLRYDKNCK